jgi:hypothetical protein
MALDQKLSLTIEESARLQRINAVIGHCSMLKLVTLAVAAAFCSTPLIAQVTIIEDARPAGKTQGPDKLTCERVETTGTRLGARRVCMTAEQWAAKRREQREDVERAQRIVNQAPSR